jgi:hypothetical protein
MKKIFAILLLIAFTTGVTSVTVATPAKDNPNGGFCKNGHPTKDLRYCPENRGRAAVAAPNAARGRAVVPKAAIRAACHEDTKRLCADVFGNLEAVRACMREHHEQLSDKCKATIAESKRQ